MFKLLTFISICLHLSSQNDCRLNMTLLLEPRRPVFVYESSSRFIYPENNVDEFAIPEDELILISCGKEKFTDSSMLYSTIEVKCVEDQFKSNFGAVDVHNLICTGSELEIVDDQRITCAENATILRVGYPNDLGGYVIPFYEVCLDHSAKNVLWVNYQASRISRPGAPLCENQANDDEEFFNLTHSTEYYYSDKVKKATINKLIGLDDDSNVYIDYVRNNYFITLTKKNYMNYNAFYFNHQKCALAHFVETAPLWKSVISFEEDNWYQMEEQLNNILNKMDRYPPQIIVGSYGVDTLPIAYTNETTELYLDVEEDDGVKQIPVPKLSWLLIFDSLNNEAVVFISVNNVYNNLTKDDVICHDVFDNVTIFDLKSRTNVLQRYTYACSYEDFNKSMPYNLPYLYVKGLLTELSNSAHSYSSLSLFILSSVISLLLSIQ